MNARASSSTVMSVGSATAVPPSSAMRRAKSSRRSARRPASATEVPDRTGASAVASPIPDVAPVMATARPWRSMQVPFQPAKRRRIAAYYADASGRGTNGMDTTRRGNYDSGEDFVLEYGELRVTFNERDFAERCEQAARKLGFVRDPLADHESEDLVNLAVNGEIAEPASGLGDHVNDCWPELVGPADRSLVHWLRRLVFRSAWLDQRVKEGELDVVFDEITHTFGYVQPERDREPIELSPEPSWRRVAYGPRRF